MASTFSELKFELIGTGDQAGNWGQTTNDNIGTAIEQAITGLGNPVFTADSNLTIGLTNTVALQTARALALNVTSTGSLTATRELVVPTIEKQYLVQNNTSGSQSIVVKTTAGTGITVPNGSKMHLYVDGINVTDAVSHFTSLTTEVVKANEIKIPTNTTDAVFTKDNNLTAWAFTGKSFLVTTQETVPTGLFFDPDGIRMYVIGSTGDDVNQYSLSTAWDVTTASFVRVSATIGETAPTGVFFKPDGTVMYITGSTNDTVREFSVGTAWDVSTITFVRDFSFAAQDTTPQDIWFKPDGTLLFMVGANNDRVYEYALATAYNVSTASFVRFFSVAAQELTPVAVNFTSDGSIMYVLGASGQDINRYTLSTPWNISTAVFFNNFYVGFQESAPTGMFIDTDYDVAYVVGSNADRVFQYDTTTDGIVLESQSGLFISGSLYTNKNLVVTSGARIDGVLNISGAATAQSTLVVASTFNASGSSTFNTTTGTLNYGTSQTTGVMILGGTAQTGAITVGRSTAAQTLDIGVGATTTGVTKTINFGTAGLSGSTTNINIGSAVAGATINTTVRGNFSVLSGITGNLSGNATTATTLQTARTIGGVSFNGSANINLPGVNTAGNQNTTGTAANVTGVVAVANGGTGVTSSTGSGANVLATSPTLVTPVLGTPSSGTLSACTVDGTALVGFRNIPQNSQSTAYTLVLGDAGRHIFHPVGDANARTFTIPANSSVAFPIGTVVTFVNMSVPAVTIAITTDTLTLSPAGTAGSRTLATNGVATCIKITATQWLITGTALT